MDFYHYLSPLFSQAISGISFSVVSVLDNLMNSITGMFPDMMMLVFFKGIIELLRTEVTDLATTGVQNMTTFVMSFAIPIVTLWIMIQGYRIMTGRSQAPLLGFVINSAKVIVIMMIATSVSVFNR